MVVTQLPIHYLKCESGEIPVAIGPRLKDLLLEIIKASYEDQIYELKRELLGRSDQINGLRAKIKTFNSTPWYARVFLALRGL